MKAYLSLFLAGALICGASPLAFGRNYSNESSSTGRHSRSATHHHSTGSRHSSNSGSKTHSNIPKN